ncbi:MAG: flagellar motor switch protein FliN [Pseudomonadales bacterium]|nr:flagellar motor switch protein FliN [Pseudomonadales bacterium]
MSDDTIDNENEEVTDDWAAALEEQGDAPAQEGADDDWASAMAEQADSEESTGAAPSADTPELQELQDDSTPNIGNPDLDVVMDIPVTISMEVGATAITIRNLLQLSQGSVVELDRLAGEPLDVLVNGKLIAHGEVVVVNEKFGIRMTDVVSQTERINRLA